MMRLIVCPVCKLCLVGFFFAVATGIIYSRFSEPTARLLFSDRALISPCEDGIMISICLTTIFKQFLRLGSINSFFSCTNI